MYIEQAQKNLTDWWRYFIGLAIALAGVLVFSIPHSVALIGKIATGDVDIDKLEDTAYLMGLFESNLNFLYILLPFAGGLIFLLFIAVKFLHKQTITSLTTSRNKIDWSRVIFAFILWGAISTIMTGIDIYFSPDDYVFNFELNKFLILAVLAIFLVPLQTSFEEYMFRGYLMQGIGNVFKNKWVPLIVTSLIFGLLHIANPEVDKLGNIIMIYYIGTGFFLGILTLMDDGMELALGFHAANNLFTALLVTADWTAFQTYSIYKSVADPLTMGVSEIIIPVFVIFPILLFIFSKKYNWNNWFNKLAGPVKDISVAEDDIWSKR
ncbi:MAG: CPBP family intramembrane glutamic endopeptidase [Flavobacteriales bacterium]|jgi:membrane protease YdiL (CAAX protease family)|tara:strand:- start:103842 stop:104810 length:969 start_codon:yes stop_codon:yes gene_type:complete